jgi:hypothetical protein
MGLMVWIGWIRAWRCSHDPIEPGDKGWVEHNRLTLGRSEQLQPDNLLGIQRSGELGQILRRCIVQQCVAIGAYGLSGGQRLG